MSKRIEWYEMPTLVWEALPGESINECYDCGPFWRCALEAEPDAAHGLVVREWHRPECPIIRDVQDGQSDPDHDPSEV